MINPFDSLMAEKKLASELRWKQEQEQIQKAKKAELEQVLRYSPIVEKVLVQFKDALSRITGYDIFYVIKGGDGVNINHPRREKSFENWFHLVKGVYIPPKDYVPSNYRIMKDSSTTDSDGYTSAASRGILSVSTVVKENKARYFSVSYYGVSSGYRSLDRTKESVDIHCELSAEALTKTIMELYKKEP
jgi:hypothetical protein